MIDTYQCNAAVKNADALVAQGVQAVGLYYFNHSAFKEQLTSGVAKALSAKGLYVVSVWEDGYPDHAAYFGSESGYSDGHRAMERASRAGQPHGTAIYFAVDYDATLGDLPRILRYFQAVKDVLGLAYEVGVYGSGLTCAFLSGQGLVTKTWLSESTGFQEHGAWLPHANIVQGHSTKLLGMDVDTDTTNGNAGGWKI